MVNYFVLGQSTFDTMKDLKIIDVWKRTTALLLGGYVEVRLKGTLALTQSQWYIKLCEAR